MMKKYIIKQMNYFNNNYNNIKYKKYKMKFVIYVYNQKDVYNLIVNKFNVKM